MKRLAGKTALVTGAARGIGLAFAQAYVREGARVALADVDTARLDRSVAAIGGGAAVAVDMDVARQESIEAGVSRAVEALGRIDILVNSAAVFTAAPVVGIGRDDYERVFAVNVAGTLFTLQAVARHMIEAGIRGRIINMASQAGRRGESLVAVYCASKAAVVSLTQSAGLNLIRHGINVNAISPGVVEGEHWDGVDAYFARLEDLAPGQKKRDVGRAVPFGRMGRADDLTGMAVFLATDEAEYIVGQTYNVDGGNWLN